jgi:peptide/nickel transport system ATP-binding protein
MNSPILEINELAVDFNTEEGSSPALRNVSMKVNSGQIVAVVGESGSGKSVTALSILRLIATPPAHYKSGEIILLEKEPKNLLALSNTEIREIRGKKISMIFQEPMTSLNPVLTCGEQVIEALTLHENISEAEAKRRTIDLFRIVKLPDPENMINRYPHQLSGGQKQRVMIAMAISCNPALLIADEPTTALDVTVQKTILTLIKDIQAKTGMAVIYITHDLSLVAGFADKVVVMYRGGIVETGDTQQIFTAPSHPYTRALLACRPSAYPKGQRLPVVSDFIGENAGPPLQRKDASGKVGKQELTLSDEKLVEVKNLVVEFPAKRNFFGKVISHTRAVDDVSFDILKGETLGLVGESGCGKTTLGRTLIRLINPTSGNIYFKGKDIAHITKADMRTLRKEIQIIFQDPYGSLNPRITIGSAILEPMKVHHILNSDQQRREKVIEVLEKVNLRAEHFSRYPHEFSGGQRQRICIARALALKPSFIICDESVSALDVSVQAQVLNLLNDLKQELGFTCIFISHDLGVVRYISDRIMVMRKGKIVETGEAEQIYNSPKDEYTKELISAIPKAPNTPTSF